MKIEIDIPDEVVKELKGVAQKMNDKLILIGLKIVFMKAIKETYDTQHKVIEWANDYLDSNEVSKGISETFKMIADIFAESKS